MGGSSRDRRHRAFVIGLGAVCVAVAAALWFRGASFYTTAPWDRLRHPDHEALRSSGSWGLGLGLIAAALILANLSFLIRKHVRALRRAGSLRAWMDMHVASGLLAPLLVLYHSAFHPRSTVAIVASVALLVLVVTGIVGRFIYALVPRSAAGQELEQADLERRVAEAHEAVEPALAADPSLAPRLDALGAAPGRVPRTRLGCLVALPGLLLGTLWLGIRLRRLGRALAAAAGEGGADLARGVFDVAMSRRQMHLFQVYRELMRWWRSLHRVFAVVMVLMLAVHVGAVLYFGYGGVEG